MKNPFQTEAAARHLKIAVTGKTNTGKTVFGLCAKLHGMGPVYVISNEAGDAHHWHHKEWGGFHRLPTNSIARVEEAITFLESSPGGTLVVDTETGVYEALVDAKAKADGSVNKLAWGLIKRKWKSLMARLNNLPMHVVHVVHENDLMEEDDKGNFKVVGQKLDVEKSFERNPDVILRLGRVDDKRVGRVLKDRTTVYPAGHVIQEPHIGLWAGAIRVGSAEERIAPPEEVAAANEAAMDTGSDRAAALAVDESHSDLMGDVLKLIDAHEDFNHEAHANNWWKQQWPLIGKLAVADQKAIRAKLNAKIKKNGNGAKETAQ